MKWINHCSWLLLFHVMLHSLSARVTVLYVSGWADIFRGGGREATVFAFFSRQWFRACHSHTGVHITSGITTTYCKIQVKRNLQGHAGTIQYVYLDAFTNSRIVSCRDFDKQQLVMVINIFLWVWRKTVQKF